MFLKKISQTKVSQVKLPKWKTKSIVCNNNYAKN